MLTEAIFIPRVKESYELFVLGIFSQFHLLFADSESVAEKNSFLNNNSIVLLLYTDIINY
jgi:hypothetical protein